MGTQPGGLPLRREAVQCHHGRPRTGRPASDHELARQPVAAKEPDDTGGLTRHVGVEPGEVQIIGEAARSQERAMVPGEPSGAALTTTARRDAPRGSG